MSGGGEDMPGDESDFTQHLTVTLLQLGLAALPHSARVNWRDFVCCEEMQTNKERTGRLCSAVHYSTVQYSAVHYITVQYSTVQYSRVQYSILQYSAVQYRTVQYSTVKQRTVQ